MFYSLLMRSFVTIYNISIVFIVFVWFSFIGKSVDAAPHEHHSDDDNTDHVSEHQENVVNSHWDGKVLKLIHVVIIYIVIIIHIQLGNYY